MGLDIATGHAIRAVQHNSIVTHHPDTGADLSAIQVPNWTELLHLATQCYDVTELGYLGCDIVIDWELGPLILELNARPGLSIQLANDTGLLPRLQQIEGTKLRKLPIADRVAYAVEHFAHYQEQDLFELA